MASRVARVPSDGEGGEYTSKAGHLNILPSRQNVILAGRRNSLTPLSLDSPMTMQRTLSSRRNSQATHTCGAEISPVCEVGTLASVDARDPLLGAAPLAGEGSPASNGSGLSEQDALSRCEAVFNLVNTVLGVGVLSIPYAFRLSGYSTLILLLLTIVVTSCTANFIGAALVLASASPSAAGVPPKGRDFIFLAHVAFGRMGRALIGVITSLEIWFALVTFMVMNGVNASILFPTLGTAQAVTISIALAASTVFLPMRFFSYLSLVSSLSLAAAAIALVGAALSMPSWANPYNQLGIPALLQLHNMPRSVGIIVFCFAGHPCFPVVHECMRDRREWNSSVGLTFCMAFVYYGGLGVFGYLVFGQGLEASFTVNLARIQGSVLWRFISATAFLVKIQLTAPLLLNAVIVSFWAPAVNKPEWPMGRVFALFGLSAMTGLTAVAFSSDVAAVASLTGSLFTMTTSVIFPALAHLQLKFLFGSPESCRLRAILPHILVLAFGVTMAIAGTALTARDMLSNRH